MNDKIFNEKAEWLEIIYQALINLNGAAKYKSIYEEVIRIAPDKCQNNKNWQAKVRQTIQRNSSDSEIFEKKGKDLFISLEGIGKGSWGIRDLIQSITYVDIIEMINQFKPILIDDSKFWKEITNFDSELYKKARNNFRSKVIQSRSLKNLTYYSDIERTIVSKSNLDMNMRFVEAAHIFDVWRIKKLIIEHKKKNVQDYKIFFYNLFSSLDNSSNALLLPFNYHKIFDMNLIWFDEKTGLMHFNSDFKRDFAKLGIYPTKIKTNVMEDEGIKKYLLIRNKYRENKLDDLWNLFNSNIF